jgi:hypothetical protein
MRLKQTFIYLVFYFLMQVTRSRSHAADQVLNILMSPQGWRFEYNRVCRNTEMPMHSFLSIGWHHLAELWLQPSKIGSFLWTESHACRSDLRPQYFSASYCTPPWISRYFWLSESLHRAWVSSAFLWFQRLNFNSWRASLFWLVQKRYKISTKSVSSTFISESCMLTFEL